MNRRRFDGRYGFFGASECHGNAMVKASLCDDQSCNDDERENKNTETTSKHAEREHGHDLKQLPEASEDLRVKSFCRRGR